MAMAMPAKAWTLDELHRLPDDGNRYEVPFIAANQLGALFHRRAVVRFDGSEAEPDLFVRPMRRATGSDQKDWDDAPSPQLVVEVCSPSTRRRDAGPKRELYLSAGAAEYWIVDPDKREVRVSRAGRKDHVTRDRLVWTPHQAPPLDIAVAALFDSDIRDVSDV